MSGEELNKETTSNTDTAEIRKICSESSMLAITSVKLTGKRIIRAEQYTL